MSLLAQEDEGFRVQAFGLPATGATTTLSVTTSSGATGPLSKGMYRFLADNACRVAKGPTAVGTDMSLVGGVPEYFHIDKGLTVAAITSTGAASLLITKC